MINLKAKLEAQQCKPGDFCSIKGDEEPSAGLSAESVHSEAEAYGSSTEHCQRSGRRMGAKNWGQTWAFLLKLCKALVKIKLGDLSFQLNYLS